ncbi:MAG: gliding motility-associated C-terminal domain-containing protein [Bacteroidia bacterium]|nr:gliding motility-associated C-terminal domain-containing protein [Bacteroidia bacterium]
MPVKYISIYKNIIFVLLCQSIFIYNLSAQLFYNNGALFFTNNDAIVYVDGQVSNNNSGIIQNTGSFTIKDNFINNAAAGGDGIYKISGDWLNNDTFSSDAGKVLLEGDAQLISGAVSTVFNILELTGTGIKMLTLDTYVDSFLILNDRELATGDDTLFIITTRLNAISYSTGFVSSITGGCLARITSLDSAYMYPVGSSQGTARFRPVEIAPASSDTNIFTVRLANNDATNDGYDRNRIDSTFCMANPAFYHLIGRRTGIDSASLTIFFNEADDGPWHGIAQWNTAPDTLWENTGFTSLTPDILTGITKPGWNDFNNEPYILIRTSLNVELGSEAVLCEGDSLLMDAGPEGETYVWSSGDTTQTVYVHVSGTYYVTVTAGICTDTDYKKVIFKPNPDADAGNDMTICVGQSTTLTVTGGITYVWSTAESSQSITVSPLDTTTYFVTATEGTCTDIDSVTVFVNSIPEADAGQNQQICEGDSITLTASGGTEFLWNTSETSQNIVITPTSTTTYSVTVTDNGCSDADSVTIDVIPTSFTDAGVNQNICEGDSAVLIASGGDSYLWSNGAVTSNTTVSPAITTTYFVTVTSGICSDIDSVTVSVLQIPVADAGPDQEICQGESVVLTANGGTNYLWNTTATTQSINVTPTLTNVYIVTVSLSNNCDALDSVTVTVNSNPVADAGLNQNICEEDSVWLTATGGGIYYWNTSDTTQTILVHPSQTMTYVVTVTEGDCSASDSVTVFVSPFPDADAGQDTAVCEGELATLTATGGTSTSTYLWNSGCTDEACFVSTPGIYFVTITSNNCSAVDSVSVFVAPSPVVDIGPPQDICLGDTIQLTAGGGESYIWSNEATTSAIIVSPLFSSVYFVTATTGECSAIDSVTIDVFPVPIANAGADQTICEGDEVILTASGGNNYQWNTSETTASINVAPLNTTVYTVTVTTGNCSDDDNVTINVKPSPDADAGMDISLCIGNSVQLNATGGGAYQWNYSEYLSATDIPNPIASPLTTTDFVLIVTSGDCSDRDTVTVTVRPIPNIFTGNDITINNSDVTQLNATGDAGLTYEWTPHTGLSNPYIANPMVDIDDTTIYAITATNLYGCKNSDSVTVFVTETQEISEEIEIYNTFTPNNDGVNDTWYIKNIEHFQDNYLEIYNRNGQKVYEKKNYQNDWEGKYFGNDLPAATYYYLLDLGDGSNILKGNVTIVR